VENPPSRQRLVHRFHRAVAAARSRRRLALVALAIPFVAGGCQLPNFLAYKGATTQGQDSFKLWQGFFITGLVVVGVVFVLILWAVLRYRRRSDEMPRQTQYHTVVEIVYTIVPILIVAVLFVFTFITENNVDSVSASPAVVVNITAFQWGWKFQYPHDGGIVVEGVETETPQMVVPTGETVRIYLRSADVVHGWYVPEFNFSRYALPGVTNQFDINVTHPGVFRGQCTQFCGLYHSLMLFSVRAVPSAQFASWVHQQEQTSQSSNSIATLKQKAAQGGYG
jgi:cytochrome c oxidase subunit 2